MHRRHALFQLAALLYVSSAAAQVQPAKVAWVRVHLDHFEFEGKAYQTRAGLAKALRQGGRSKRMAIKWVMPKAEIDRVNMTRKVEEARGAVADAGLKPLQEVANEIF